MKIEFSPETDIEVVRDLLVGSLTTAVCKVDFTKINGEHRLMTCTLLSNHLPPLTESAEKKEKTLGNTLSVWDVEKSSWRSFRLNQVNSIEIEEQTDVLV